MRPNLHIPRKCEQLRANQVDLFLKILHICGFVVNNLHICGLGGVIVKWQRGHWESPKTVAEGDFL